MLEELPPDALALVLQASLLPAAGSATAAGWESLRTLAALRCVSRRIRAAAESLPVALAAVPRRELAPFLAGLVVRSLHFLPPAGAGAEYKAWMPGHSLTAWLSSLQIGSGLAVRQALQQNLRALVASLR